MIVQRISVALALVAAIASPAASQSTKASQEAIQALQHGEAEKAASAFAEALEQSPRDPRLHFGAGVAAHLRGRDEEARGFLRRALELEPRLIAAAALFGELAYEAGDTDLAIRTYEQALKYAPTERSMAARLQVWRDEEAKERRVDGPFSIAFEGPAEAELAAHATKVLDTAYWRLGKTLGAYPSDPITVVFYTLKQFRAVTGAPEWAGATFDTRIRMPVRGALATRAEFDRLLTHEFAHAMIVSLAPRGVPAWLHEGLATYLEPGDVRGAERRLRAGRTFVPLDRLRDGFGELSQREARAAYDESLVATSLLMERLGPRVSIVLEALGRGQDMTAALAQFGLSYPGVELGVASRVK